jgi:hypothetical protein
MFQKFYQLTINILVILVFVFIIYKTFSAYMYCLYLHDKINNNGSVVSPSKFMNATIWVHCAFDSQIFGRGKVYYSDSIKFYSLLTLLILCKLSIPIVGLKITSLPTLALRSRNKIFMWYLGNLSNTCSSSSWKLSFISSILSSVGVWACRMMISHQRPLSITYDILSLTNSTLLTPDVILLCTKKACT